MASLQAQVQTRSRCGHLSSLYFQASRPSCPILIPILGRYSCCLGFKMPKGNFCEDTNIPAGKGKKGALLEGTSEQDLWAGPQCITSDEVLLPPLRNQGEEKGWLKLCPLNQDISESSYGSFWGLKLFLVFFNTWIQSNPVNLHKKPIWK